jgi:hypothetical protein
MNRKVDWNTFMETTVYKNMNAKGKQALTYLCLDEIPISEEFLTDFILLDKGKITTEEFKKNAIRRATAKLRTTETTD